MNIENFISDAVRRSVEALYGPLDGEQLQIQKTRREFEGDYTLVTFPLLRRSRKSPEATATEIGEYMTANVPEVKSFNVIKGFLNLTLDCAFWAARFAEIAADANFGQAPDTGRTVMIEYSSPNTNKPLHLGHIRNNLLGYSVAQILRANGHNVIKANLVNDRGIHICKSMLAWKLYGNGETPASSGMKGDHLVGKYYVEFDKHYKAQIDLIERLTAQIFDCVRKNPKKLSQIRQFLNYYLPTTIKLMEQYVTLQNQSLKTENITEGMQKIEDLLDKVIIAFQRQLDALFEADVVDITADIRVMEQMMASEGLTNKKDFA